MNKFFEKIECTTAIFEKKYLEVGATFKIDLEQNQEIFGTYFEINLGQYLILIWSNIKILTQIQ